jgi:hypothetical protein
MLTGHAQRSRDSDRDLRDAGKMLDVAGKERRVERVRRDVGQIGAGLFADELSTPGSHFMGVVVFFAAGNADTLACRSGVDHVRVSSSSG